MGDLVEMWLSSTALLIEPSQVIGGNGGGKPTLAQAGGIHAAELANALQVASARACAALNRAAAPAVRIAIANG